MNIAITDEAVNWFKKEFDVSGDGRYFRFYARYGGNCTIQSGFSLGFTQQLPKQIGAKSEVDGFVFFIEEDDLWYFEGYDLKVEYDKKWDEIKFVYVPHSR